jgi:hypothetical protein
MQDEDTLSRLLAILADARVSKYSYSESTGDLAIEFAPEAPVAPVMTTIKPDQPVTGGAPRPPGYEKLFGNGFPGFSAPKTETRE